MHSAESWYDHHMKQTSLLVGIGAFLFVALVGWFAFGYFGIQALFTDTVVDEPIPSLSSTVPAAGTSTSPIAGEKRVTPFLRGSFAQGDSTYSIQGTATIIEQEAQHVLALTDFSVTNGPDLYVYLVTASTTENGAVKTAVKEGKFVEISPLKGNRGNQMYVLPKQDLAPGQVVSVWCKRFSRNFGSALLR